MKLLLKKLLRILLKAIRGRAFKRILSSDIAIQRYT